jgi:hypothetical protein
MEQLRQKKEKTQQVIERTKAGNLEAGMWSLFTIQIKD